MISLDTPCVQAVPMSEGDHARSVSAASVIIRPAVTEAIGQAGDARLSADQVTAAARQAVEAWAAAVAGNGAALAALASTEAAHWLLHPVRKNWQVGPGPDVTEIDVWGLNAGAQQPVLKVSFRFTGPQVFGAPDGDAGTAAEGAGGDTDFVGMLTLSLAGTAGWQLASGHVRTLDEFLGYVFTSRHETQEEYLERAGQAHSAASTASAADQRAFLITAGFAEHDARFGASASLYAQLASAPAREEAVRLVWPAVVQETARALGAGDWQPSLNWLDVVELRPDTRDAPGWPGDCGSPSGHIAEKD
jgi:hypothetical protein